MRRLSIIAYFPRAGVGVLMGAFAAATLLPSEALAAPKKTAESKAPAADTSASAGSAAPGAPDAKTKKAAREAYGGGEKAYGRGDYAAAFLEFKKAYDLIPTIHAQYWMAMSQSYGPETSDSYDALTAVLAAPDKDKLGDDKIAAANARLEELKKTPATVDVTSTPPGAEVSVDGAAQPGVTPTTVSIVAGTHKLGVGAQGYEPYAIDFTVKPGEKLQQAAELTKQPEAAPPPPPPPVAAVNTLPPPPPPPKAPPSKVPAYVTLGVGVAAAAVGTVFGIEALSAKSDFNKNPTNSGADKAERDALIADMSFGIALTLGITGIVLLTTSGDSDVAAKAEPTMHLARARLQVAPVLSPTTQGAAARLTF